MQHTRSAVHWLKPDPATTSKEKLEETRMGNYVVNVSPLTWQRTPPTVPGTWVYKGDPTWMLIIGEVAAGNWRQSQDPSKLHFGRNPIDRMDRGWRLGPLPQIPPDEEKWRIDMALYEASREQ